MWLTWLAGLGFGFCGTYVGPAGSTLVNAESRIVVADSGPLLTLTLANDFAGDAQDFALVIPVPAGFGEEGVSVVDPHVLDRVDEYSAPRVVSYSCSQLYPYEWGGHRREHPDYRYKGGLTSSEPLDSLGCGYEQAFHKAASTATGTYGAAATVPGVEVEAKFLVGGYEMYVVDATGSNGLVAWLEGNGFEVPLASQDLLDEYIDSGAHFLAARVALGEEPVFPAYLSPIQLSWPNDGPISLPIRLGALNSAGTQDLTLYAVSSRGEAYIATYPELEVERTCMLDGPDAESAATYGDLVDRAFEDVDVGWITEYSFGPTKCDPCVGAGPLGSLDLQALGFHGSVGRFTRMRMRYTPGALDQDLVLEFAPSSAGNRQLRLIAYDRDLESEFPVCGVGMVKDPGTCLGAASKPFSQPEGGAACSTSPVGWSVSALVLAILAGVRRRD